MSSIPNSKLRSRIVTGALTSILLLAASCSSLNTHLSVRSPHQPAAFTGANPEKSIVTLSWREYFGDSLLLSLIDTALNNNQDLMMAYQRIEVARAEKRAAIGNLFPEVSANVNGGYRRYGLYTMDGAGNISTEILPGKIVPVDLPDIYAGLQMAWEIDIWGKLRNMRKAALAEYLAGIEGSRLVQSALVADVSNAYYALVALDQELGIIRQFTQKQKEALQVIRLQKESGRANELAVQQFEAQLLSAEAMEYETLQKMTEMENLINFLLGRYPQKIDRSNSLSAASGAFAAGVPSDLLLNRPDVRQAEYLIQSSRFELKSARAAFFPNINITGAFGYQAFEPSFLFRSPESIAYTAIGGVLAPLLNRSALKSRFGTAKARQITALHQYQKTLLTAYMEVANELSRRENLNKVQILRQQQSEVLDESIETSMELYSSAKAGYIEVLYTQQNALQARLALADVIRQQQHNRVNLYKALGGGWR